MSYTRRPASEITPEYEDAGLFKQQVVRLTLEMVPLFGFNSRRDLVIGAFVRDTKSMREIELIFAGRRTKDAQALVNLLRERAAQAHASARAAGQPQPEPKSIRLPGRVEGSWRKRFERDANGMEKRSFQFIAARWSIADGQGGSATFGMPPVIYPQGPKAGKTG